MLVSDQKQSCLFKTVHNLPISQSNLLSYNWPCGAGSETAVQGVRIVIPFLLQRLYRRKPGMAAIASKLPQNLGKNRYRDISACECPEEGVWQGRGT